MYTMKKYDSDGHRLTNCCGAFSTFMEGEVLCCKACYREVSFGEGDGSDDLVFQTRAYWTTKYGKGWTIRDLDKEDRITKGRECCITYGYTVESLVEDLDSPCTRDEAFFYRLCYEAATYSN